MAAHVLLIDDDEEVVEMVTKYLSESGLTVSSATTPSKGLEALRGRRPSLVVLDVMLPEKSGLDLCKEIRKDSRVPILMLTARGEVVDRVIGLELGADDYLAKPFEPRELLARIHSILRRTEGQPLEVTELRFPELEIDARKRTVIASGKRVEISTTEFEALLYLARRPGEVISRDRLLEHLRGSNCEAFNRSIDTLISRLRTKIGDNPQNPRFIKTVWGTGYLFVAGHGE